MTYLDILWRRKWIVVVTVIACLTVVAIGNYVMTPIYAASTTLRVATASEGSIDYQAFDVQYADRLMNTYTQMATSTSVLAKLNEQLGRAYPPVVKAEIIANTELIRLTVEDPNAAVAREAADALAAILVDHIAALEHAAGATAVEVTRQQLLEVQAELSLAQQEYQRLAADLPESSPLLVSIRQALDAKQSLYVALLRQVEQARLREAVRAEIVSVADPAVLPQTPIRPRKVLNLALGLLVALGAGTGLAFLFENLAVPNRRVPLASTFHEPGPVEAPGTRPRTGATLLARGPAHDKA